MTRSLIRWIALISGGALMVGCLLWAGLFAAVLWQFGGLKTLWIAVANNPGLWVIWAAFLITGAALVALARKAAPKRPDSGVF